LTHRFKPTKLKSMTELPNSERVERGFHRIGVALAIVLGVSTLAIGTTVSIERANLQQERLLSLWCANELTKMEKSPGQSKWDDLLLQAECHYFLWSGTAEELAASRNSGFSYSATLASYLGITVLLTGFVGLVAYFSIAALSWIVRGFMHG
jgi:hypothetical protein